MQHSLFHVHCSEELFTLHTLQLVSDSLGRDGPSLTCHQGTPNATCLETGDEHCAEASVGDLGL